MINKYLLVTLLPFALFTSCTVSPIQSARVTSRLAVNMDGSYASSYCGYTYDQKWSSDTTVYHHSDKFYLGASDSNTPALNLPYVAAGIQNKVQISGYIIPLPPTLVMAGGFSFKLNIFDFQRDKKLFRDFALAVNTQLSLLTSERTDYSYIEGGLIFGTYHSFTYSELELIFMPRASRISITSKYDDFSPTIEFNTVDLGLGALYWLGKNRHFQINGGMFLRIPYSLNVSYKADAYVKNITFEKYLSPWIGHLGFSVEILKQKKHAPVQSDSIGTISVAMPQRLHQP